MENFKSLAEFAYKNENYQETYQYSTKAIEIEINDSDLWLMKGISCSMLARDGNSKSKAIRSLIKKSIELGIEENKLQEEIIKLRQAYELQIKYLEEMLLDGVRDYQKVSMPKNGSALIHMAGQTINKHLIAAKQAPTRYDALDLLLLMCEIYPTESNCNYTLTSIERIKKHSKENGAYLKIEGKENYLYLIGLIEDKIFKLNKPNIKNDVKIYTEESRQESKKPSKTPYVPIIFWSIFLLFIITKCS